MPFSDPSREPEEVLTAQIAKYDDDQQIVFGWASVSIGKDGKLVVDREGDVIEPDVLETAAYDFVLNSRRGDDLHDEVTKSHLVESMVFTREKMAKMGLTFLDAGVRKSDTPVCMWWTGFYVPDASDWSAIKLGKRAAFSIGGFATREEIVDEIGKD
jgi:hypothetical protein